MASTASFIARRAALCCSIVRSRIRAVSAGLEEHVELVCGALPGELLRAGGAGGAERVVAQCGLDRDAAGHGLQAGEAEALVPGGQDEGARPRVEAGEVLVGDVAEGSRRAR